MTRKKYIKCLMGFGVSRNHANATAAKAREFKLPYYRCISIKDGSPIFHHTNIDVFADTHAFKMLNKHKKIGLKRRLRRLYRKMNIVQAKEDWNSLNNDTSHMINIIYNWGINKDGDPIIIDKEYFDKYKKPIFMCDT